MEKVAKLLSEAADLSKRAAALAEDDQLSAALALEEEADRLRSRARIAARRATVDRRANAIERNISDIGTTNRQVTIAALNEIAVPTSPRYVAEYALARFGALLDYRMLAALRRDEQRAWSSPRTQRPVYVVPALEGSHFLAVRGKLALSSWPLDQRLIGPWSERVDHLRATLNAVHTLSWLRRSESADADALVGLVGRNAATVPGAFGSDDDPDQARIESAIQIELAALQPDDIAWRAAAADRARAILDESEMLWGTKPPSAVRREVG